jgi:hypothetical protein
MRLWMALLALGPACGFNSNSNSNSDAMHDASSPDASQLCFGSFVKVCFNTAADVPTAPPALPTGPMVLINTDSDAACDRNNDQAGAYCVVAGSSFSLAANQTLRAYGSKPLVLLSTSTFDLAGIVDVSSNHVIVGSQGSGAGANPVGLCTGADAAQDSGGGPGGSFGGKGGDGARMGGTSGGVAAPAISSPATSLRGGCPGGNGAPDGGGGGSSGGAVAVIAATLHLTGRINASGAGGTTGVLTSTGAGGGGSGGMIALDVAMLTGNGMLFANGGGGGAGGPGNASGAESASPADSAAGGKNMPATGGGAGGDGAIGTLQGFAGGNAQANGGGGGGGGGVGVIRAHGVMTNISPPSST